MSIFQVGIIQTCAFSIIGLSECGVVGLVRGWVFFSLTDSLSDSSDSETTTKNQTKYNL